MVNNHPASLTQDSAQALLSSHRPYQEGGPDYYHPTDTDRLKDRLVQRLEKLGFAVTIAAAETAA